jgi:quercetin dioxygenase-like cupin family protein
MAIDRMELAAGARYPGSPHSPGTHEFLYCERGRITLRVSGEQFELQRGSVAAFPGDQRHSYENPGSTLAIGFSVVSLAPVDNILARFADGSPAAS